MVMLIAGFPLVGGTGGGDPPPPLPEKSARPPHVPPHCFDPKMLILSFSCSFWPFCPNCPSPPLVDPNWETLHSNAHFKLE